MNETAFKLAAEGKSNAEIWGALNLTSGALQKVIQTNPALLFSIINGRSQFMDPIVGILVDMAHGGEDVSKGQWAAMSILLERAEAQNRVLTVSYEMILMTGTGAAPATEQRDAATVTQLLRKKA